MVLNQLRGQRTAMTNFHISSSRLPIHRNSPFQIAIVICCTATLSYLATRIGGALVLRPEVIWPLWPGCAFRVALLLLTPRRIWPVILITGLSGFALYDAQETLPIRAIVLLLLADAIKILVGALGVQYVFNGVPRRILDIGVPWFNQDGLFQGDIGIAVDITEQRMAEKVLPRLRGS